MSYEWNLILSSQNDKNSSYGRILNNIIETIISKFRFDISAKKFVSNLKSSIRRILSSTPNGFEIEEMWDLRESWKILILHKCTCS